MAVKYCKKHDIWYDYNEECPECTKFGRIAGQVIGTAIGAVVGGTILAGKKIAEYNKTAKEKQLSKISGSINTIWQEHNVHLNQDLGLRIHIKFDVHNMLNQSGSIGIYFYDKKKKPLIDCNQNYNSVDGQVSVGGTFTPNYQNCTYNDYSLFIPYSELHLPKGKSDIFFKIYLFDPTNTVFTISDYQSFYVNMEEAYNIPINTQTGGMPYKPEERKIHPIIIFILIIGIGALIFMFTGIALGL